MRFLLIFVFATALFSQTATYVGLGNVSTYTDVSGILWSADTGCSGGTQFTSNNSIQGTSDPILYQHGRLSTSAFSCTYTVSNNIFYNITLKFANTQSFTNGQRVFNIFINNTLVKGSFDLAGNGIAQNSAFDLGFLIPVSNSQVSINLQPINGGVLLNAISIVASGPGTLTGNNAFTGTNTFTNLNSILFAGPGATPTIDTQITACGSNPCLIFVSSGYTGPANVTAVPFNATVFDLRGTSNIIAGNTGLAFNTTDSGSVQSRLRVAQNPVNPLSGTSYATIDSFNVVQGALQTGAAYDGIACETDTASAISSSANGRLAGCEASIAINSTGGSIFDARSITSNGRFTAAATTNLTLFQSGTAAPALTFTTSAVGNYYGYADIDVSNAGISPVIKLTFSGTSFTGKASATVERII